MTRADEEFFSATLQPLTGKLYTHLRTKHVFLVHLFLFEVGSLVCATATSSAMLIGGRALAGAGAAGLMNGSLTIISEGTSLEKRPCKSTSRSHEVIELTMVQCIPGFSWAVSTSRQGWYRYLANVLSSWTAGYRHRPIDWGCIDGTCFLEVV